MRRISNSVSVALILISAACSPKKNEQAQLPDLKRGAITLCGSGADQFGTIDFNLSCSENSRADFNLATALLHSFEYGEAERIMFALVPMQGLQARINCGQISLLDFITL